MTALQDEINKRRTFAIISHPDAGKRNQGVSQLDYYIYFSCPPR